MKIRRPAGRENMHKLARYCLLISAMWLLVGIPLTVRFRPLRAKDFPQFYMGGLIARNHAWESLYPNPNLDSPYNPGLKWDSTMKPRYQELAANPPVETGDEPRFIQIPPAAVLFVPLTFLPYRVAYVTWSVLMGACCLGSACLARRFYEICLGRPSPKSALLIPLISCSYLAYIVIRCSNIELLISLLLGLGALGLIRKTPMSGGLAVVLAFVIKYASAVYLPVMLFARRWRMLAATLLIGALMLAATLPITGIGPWREFRESILPRLSRPYDNSNNQSLQGAIMFYTDQFPLSAGNVIFCRVLAGVGLAGLLALFATRPARYWKAAPVALAACAAMVGWLLIFSPLTWDKYSTYFFPLWGWLAWEATRSRVRGVWAGLSIALVWAPWFSVVPHWPGVLSYHMLAGTVLLTLLATARVYRGDESAGESTPSGAGCPPAEINA